MQSIRFLLVENFSFSTLLLSSATFFFVFYFMRLEFSDFIYLFGLWNYLIVSHMNVNDKNIVLIALKN